MLIGVPKEIKNNEYRVGLTPDAAKEYIKHGHEVMIETNAGIGINASDTLYQEAGCTIAPDASAIFAKSDMVIKVKEPQASEVAMLRDGQLLYTYLHLAAEEPLTKGLVNSGSICFAYETVTDNHGRLPLLVPMSEVAGRMSIQVGAHYLERAHGGKGVLLGGVSGVLPAHVTVVGGGVAGLSAARMAMGLGANVTIFDNSNERLAELDMLYGKEMNTCYSTESSLAQSIAKSDLVIGSVLIPGASAPKLVKDYMIASMDAGSVVVDIAIDQGGCFETSRPTSHADPIYVTHDIVHYCVTNMPGAVPRTSTYALNNATLRYGLYIANNGWKQAISDNPHIANGLNVAKGHVTYKIVADTFNMPYVEAQSIA